jgi:hypothetical protein
MKRVKFIFAWYDFWIGLFWDSKRNALYILPLPMFGVRITIYGRRCWVIRKRGYFYRTRAKGYTDRIEEAGRYTYAEAQRLEYPHDEPVTKHHLREFLG